MEVPKRFRDRLRLARNSARLSLPQLGRMVGLAGATIGRLERGETHQISIEALRRLARALGVTTDWLLAMDTLEESPDDETVLAAPHAAAHVTSVLHAG